MVGTSFTMRLLFFLLPVCNTAAFSPPNAFAANPSCSVGILKSEPTTRLYQNNRSYLDSINEEEERRNFRNDRSSRGQGNNSSYFNYNKNGGGTGTAAPVRPNYGMGGGASWNNNAGGSKIISIKQPQDLLDFVIEDERLSVGESNSMFVAVMLLVSVSYIICGYAC